MPNYLVKPERDVDFYVEWSTVTDSPHTWGSKQELQENGRPGFLGERRFHSDRFARADEFGTSDMSIREFGWDDEYLVVMNMPKDGLLRRENLRKYLDSIVLEAGRFGTRVVSVDESLIEPFPEG